MQKLVKTLALSLGLFASAASQAGLVTVEVDARTATISSRLATGVVLTVGDNFSISADPFDLWNAGPLPRWSNADGLVADLFATGADESGQSSGTLIGQSFGLYTASGFNAPYGSLVGFLGSSTFLVGTSFSGTAADSGELALAYWDGGYNDNTDSVKVTIETESVPAPATLALFGLGLAGLGYSRRKKA